MAKEYEKQERASRETGVEELGFGKKRDNLEFERVARFQFYLSVEYAELGGKEPRQGGPNKIVRHSKARADILLPQHP